ncbi:MAG: pyrimidine-nucleoside phosphorylase [Ignavibacteriales bacterium]
MRIYDIIEKKKKGEELTKEEINYLITGFCEQKIFDYQVAALLMAIYFKGMSKQEISTLTMAMASSGDMIDLSEIKGIKVDKHSSGGVGDKTTLIVAPLVAAAGIPVAKMSGRALGHSGGTIDKLEAIEGFNTAISREKFIESVNKINIAIAGQTGNLVPADKKLYALRDVTATVDSIPLIASSIMSKKIAGGADAIVLDVKAGSGAFMKDAEKAKELAKVMVEIGESLNRKTVAVVSNMDQPLGYAVGNSLEVKEAIETLKGKGPKDLEEICLVLGAYMLKLSGRTEEIPELKNSLKELLANGKAFEKFREMVVNQGGNVDLIDNPEKFKQAEFKIPVKAENDGYITAIKTDLIGIASMQLGAGRESKEDKIEYDVGVIVERKIGDKVSKGDVLAWMHANDNQKAQTSEKIIIEAYTIEKNETVQIPLIIDIIEAENS